ncbi:MAG: hypothetical protein CSA20_08535 [Deltaproteobacteria bacterium]|nr:MAG: hypothetical protein CSA20_08535 [Deltaproteobacteria bacterium]
MRIDLRDGKVTADPRCDRLEHFDERSKSYRVDLLGAEQQKTVRWEVPVQLDQGMEGACVGFGISHALAVHGVRVDNLSARQLYWATQLSDAWRGGAYPGACPHYEGTAVLYGLKTTKELGLIGGYTWAFSLADVIDGLQHGPAVLGCRWSQGMASTDAHGFVVYDDQALVGGHCACITGADIRYRFLTIKNSWGTGWGANGCCHISFPDFEKLLANKGEVAFIQQVQKIQKGE